MKTIIAGSRDITDGILLLRCIGKLDWSITEVVCGKAQGVDTLGEAYGLVNNIKVAYFPAEWKKYGKRAGYKRNSDMANYAEALLALWDGKSKGTKNMIYLAKKYRRRVAVYNYLTRTFIME